MPKPTKPEIELAVVGQKAKASTYNDNFQTMLDYVDECMDYAVLADLSNLNATGEAHFVKPNVAVTHTANTAVGSSSTPVYINSSGVATACSGLNTNNLCCTTKPTTSSTASSTKPAVITQNYLNGNAWYRVWSDGWIEQGGYALASNMTDSGISRANKKISFAKQFTSAPPIVVTQKGNHSNTSITYIGTTNWGNSQELVINVTTSSFCTQVASDNGYNGCCWYACGY